MCNRANCMKIIWISFLLTTLLLTSCDLFISSKSDNEIVDKIPFQTIFKGFKTEKADDFESVVLRNYVQAYNFLSEYLSEVPARHKLFDINYSDSLVIGVFTSGKPNNSYSIEIDSVLAYMNSVNIYVTEYGSAFGGRVIVFPGHFIKGSNTDVQNKKFDFDLTRICELEPCTWSE